MFIQDLEVVETGSLIGRIIYVPNRSVKIYSNPDKSRRNSLDPSECLLVKVAGIKALAR